MKVMAITLVGVSTIIRSKSPNLGHNFYNREYLRITIITMTTMTTYMIHGHNNYRFFKDSNPNWRIDRVGLETLIIRKVFFNRGM